MHNDEYEVARSNCADVRARTHARNRSGSQSVRIGVRVRVDLLPRTPHGYACGGSVPSRPLLRTPSPLRCPTSAAFLATAACLSRRAAVAAFVITVMLFIAWPLLRVSLACPHIADYLLFFPIVFLACGRCVVVAGFGSATTLTDVPHE